MSFQTSHPCAKRTGNFGDRLLVLCVYSCFFLRRWRCLFQCKSACVRISNPVSGPVPFTMFQYSLDQFSAQEKTHRVAFASWNGWVVISSKLAVSENRHLRGPPLDWLLWAGDHRKMEEDSQDVLFPGKVYEDAIAALASSTLCVLCPYV